MVVVFPTPLIRPLMDIHQRLFLFICQYQISSEMGQGLASTGPYTII